MVFELDNLHLLATRNFGRPLASQFRQQHPSKDSAVLWEKAVLKSLIKMKENKYNSNYKVHKHRT